MSWDVTLGTPVVKVESHCEGGTYAVGGTDEATLNITWNYSKYYYALIDKEQGLRWLAGKRAKHVISRLEFAVDILGTVQDRDYWAVTPGNAGFALSILLSWARQHPRAVFRVS